MLFYIRLGYNLQHIRQTLYVSASLQRHRHSVSEAHKAIQRTASTPAATRAMRGGPYGSKGFPVQRPWVQAPRFQRPQQPSGGGFGGLGNMAEQFSD
eukprot:573286-Pyramimonas_sp.AAC.1